MLSKILTKRECADCRFCCAFRRKSAWETPIFTKESIDKLKKEFGEFKVKKCKDSLTLDLSEEYRTKDSEEEAPCPFLDKLKGCMLNDEDKPFDCKIWPLRVMRKDKDIVIALTPTCPEINKVHIDKVKELVSNDIGDIIFEQAEKLPDMIKEYKEDFPVILVKTK